MHSTPSHIRQVTFMPTLYKVNCEPYWEMFIHKYDVWGTTRMTPHQWMSWQCTELPTAMNSQKRKSTCDGLHGSHSFCSQGKHMKINSANSQCQDMHNTTLLHEITHCLVTWAKNWVAEFKCGNFSTCDAPRPGQPKTVTTLRLLIKSMRPTLEITD